jgi:hypothetical protein
MGGSNSGRWAGYERKRLVEETPALDLAHPAVREALQGPLPKLLRVEWTTPDGGQAAMGCRVLVVEFTPGRRQLWFVRGDDQIGGEDGRDPEPVELESVQMGFAGPRWFGLCTGCGRRMRRIYILDDRVGCWRCSGLTHRSAQTHDKRVARLLKAIRRGDESVIAGLRLDARRGTYGKVARAKLFTKALDKLMAGATPDHLPAR